jgi:hypothetical protein
MTSLSTSIVRQELLKNPTGILRPNGRVHCNSLAPPPPPEAPLRCAGSALGSHPQGGRPAAHLFSPEHPCHWQGLLTNPTGLRRPERKKSLYRIRSPSLNPRLRSLSGLGLSASHPQGEALAPNPFSSTTPVLLAGTVRPLGLTSLGWDADRPKGTRQHPSSLILSAATLQTKSRCGEAGIRTLGGGFPPQLLSRQLPSAARPPLPKPSQPSYRTLEQ